MKHPKRILSTVMIVKMFSLLMKTAFSLEYVLIDNQKNIFFVSGQNAGQSYLENVLNDT
jgi:hypothetical protein